MPFNADSSFWSNLSFMARREMKTVQDYQNYIARLNDVPRYFGQQTENMRAGLKRAACRARCSMAAKCPSPPSPS